MLKGGNLLYPNTAYFLKNHTWIFRHTATKLQNPKDKNRILGTTKEERQTIYKELTIRSLISQNRDKKKINSYYQNMGNWLIIINNYILGLSFKREH